MSSTQTKQYLERKATVEQELKSQKFSMIEHYKGISTMKRLAKRTGINEQAIKRIVANLKKENRVDVIGDKSHIVLLKTEK